MSFLLSCPNCGTREVAEFRYAGELLRPLATTVPPQGANLPGRQRERWFHRFGCRRWLWVERDLRSNEVVTTGWLEEAPS
jgi:heterotetrameric sarcosine oxidase delta subunit